MPYGEWLSYWVTPHRPAIDVVAVGALTRTVDVTQPERFAAQLNAMIAARWKRHGR